MSEVNLTMSQYKTLKAILRSRAALPQHHDHPADASDWGGGNRTRATAQSKRVARDAAQLQQERKRPRRSNGKGPASDAGSELPERDMPPRTPADGAAAAAAIGAAGASGD